MGLIAFTLHPFAEKLARPAHGFSLFTGTPLRWLLVIATKLHLAENPLTLHLLLQRTKGLVDIVVTNLNLHVETSLLSGANKPGKPGICEMGRNPDRGCREAG